MEESTQKQYNQSDRRLTVDEFTNGVDGLVNDFRDGASTENEFRDGVLDLLQQVAGPHLNTQSGPGNAATLNQYRDECHAMAVSKGFHNRKKALPEMLMLIVSELGECCEADRKGKCTEPIRDFVRIMLEDESDKRFVQQFKLSVKDTVEDELADALIRIFDTAGALGIDINSHVRAKMRYNSTRPVRHGKAY